MSTAGCNVETLGTASRGKRDETCASPFAKQKCNLSVALWTSRGSAARGANAHRMPRHGAAVGAHHVGERALGTGPQHKLVHSGNADRARGFPFREDSAFSQRFSRAREASAAGHQQPAGLGWALTTASISAWSRSQDLNGRAASIAGPARSAHHLSPRIQRRARPSSAPSRWPGARAHLTTARNQERFFASQITAGGPIWPRGTPRPCRSSSSPNPRPLFKCR